MTGYQNLHWDSLNFIKNYLYQHLATPLNNALGRIAIAQHLYEPLAAQEQLRQVEQSLELALNMIQAWAALIHVQNGGVIDDDQHRVIKSDSLPSWLLDRLSEQTTLSVKHSQPLWVHPEVFYESLLMLCEIGVTVGVCKRLLTVDAKGDPPGVWIRLVFEPLESIPYTSLSGLIAGLDLSKPEECNRAVQFQVLGGLFEINRARFTLQNNTQTGEQALAALLPIATPAQQAAAAPLDSSSLISRDTPLPGAEAHPTAVSVSEPEAPVEVAAPPSGSSESTDQVPLREPDMAPDTAPEPAAELSDDTAILQPHLAGPILARPPHEIQEHEGQPIDESTSLLSQPTIDGPVLAPTPRVVGRPQTKPLDPERARPGSKPARIPGLKPPVALPLTDTLPRTEVLSGDTPVPPPAALDISSDKDGAPIS